jgi:hypothetical protein
MLDTTHLHGPLANVEKLADFLAVLFPMFLLTDPGAVHGGSACTAAKDWDIFRWCSLAVQADPGHG